MKIIIFQNKHAVGKHGRPYAVCNSFSSKMWKMLNYIEYVECMNFFTKLWIRMDSLQLYTKYKIQKKHADSNLTLNIWYKSEIIIHHHFRTDFVDFSSSSVELDSDCNFGMINWKEMKYSQLTVWYNEKWIMNMFLYSWHLTW